MHQHSFLYARLKFFIVPLFLIFLNSCDEEKPKLTTTYPVNVVVLLPLSGTYGYIGDSYLKAIQMALFDFADLKLNAQILDTKGTFEGTLEALKHVKKADVILGPLMSTSVDAAAVWASKRQIPVISLTNNFEKAQPGVFVFGIPPQDEIDAMVAFAIQRRMDRFTAILPAGSFGGIMKESIEKTLKNYGGKLIDVHFYSPNMDELPFIMKAMKKKTVDGIFIVNGGQDLFTLSNAIQADKISGRILGTQKWKSSDVNHWRQLSGAWYTTAHTPEKKIFETRYFSLYKKEPDVGAYLAYDAMAMLAKLHKLGNDRPFSINALTYEKGFIGLQGVFKLNKNGDLKRTLNIMEISQGETRMIGVNEGQ